MQGGYKEEVLFVWNEANLCGFSEILSVCTTDFFLWMLAIKLIQILGVIEFIASLRMGISHGMKNKPFELRCYNQYNMASS